MLVCSVAKLVLSSAAEVGGGEGLLRGHLGCRSWLVVVFTLVRIWFTRWSCGIELKPKLDEAIRVVGGVALFVGRDVLGLMMLLKNKGWRRLYVGRWYRPAVTKEG